MQHSVFVLYAGLIPIALAGNVRLNVSASVAIEISFANSRAVAARIGKGNGIAARKKDKEEQ